MRYEVNLDGINCKEQFHKRVEETIPCPEHYGKNLDALYDVLTEYGEQTQIVWKHFQDFLQTMPGYAEAVKALCEDAQAENPMLCIILE